MDNKLKINSVTNSSAKLYLNRERADFYFIFSNEIVPVNKCILAAASPVFRDQFYGPTKITGDSMAMDDSTSEEFKEFLQLFYLNEITFTKENVYEVTRLVTKYGMVECLSSVAELLANQLTMDNILWTYKWAITCKYEKLKQCCEKYIGMTIHDVFQSDAFKRCDRDVLQGILENDKLCCKETDVLDACLLWARYACQKNGLDETNAINLGNQLGDCLYLIRFGTLKIEELAAYSVSHEGLLTFDDHKNILHGTAFKTTPRYDTLDLGIRKMDQILFCTRDYEYDSDYSGYFANYESYELRFSVNVPAVLCKFKFVRRHRCTPSMEKNNDFNVKLVELSNGSRDSADPDEKILLTCSSQVEDCSSPLKRAYVIHSYKQYAIRLVQNSYEHSCACYVYQTPWNTEYNLYDRLVVNLLEERPGLIQSLGFQLI